MTSGTTPIRRTLTSMVLLTTGIVLLISTAATFAYQYVTYRQSAMRNLAVLGEIVATNSTAALAFENSDDAQDVLAALEAEPHVVAAALYDGSGHLFAHYPESSPTHALPSLPSGAGYDFEKSHLSGFQPVLLNGRSLGTLYLRSDMVAINEQLMLHGLIALLVAMMASVVAYVASRSLQRQISAPILALANAAQAVSDRRDYAVRAAPAEGYELGLLTNTFNDMLSRIQGQHSRVNSQLGRLHLLQHITRAIGERHDLASLFRVVLQSLEDNLPIDFGCIGLCENGLDSLTIQTVGRRSVDLARRLGIGEQAHLSVERSGLARCMSGDLVYEPDTTTSFAGFPQRFAAADMRSIVIAPLQVESRVVGVLIAGRHGAQAFQSGDCEFLRQLCEHVALAAHQLQLHTALQKAYDDLRQTQQTVMQQERLRALGQMASGIAHDINNAISPVALYTESLLEREPNLSPRAREYMTTIQRAIEDVASTVARMREFYRERESEVVFTRMKLNRIVDQVVTLTRARWNDLPQQRGVMIEVKKDLEPDLPEVTGAESELRDALTNLIFNAVDAMPEGGRLTLRTRVITVGDAPHVALEVTDSGIGMDEETRRRCLEPFFTTKGERGTGLGLAMVYGMIQRHGAELELDSEPGAGTTVRLVFATAKSAETTTAQVIPAEIPQGLRILLVDDDPVVIKSLRDTLEADGHVVTAANGGQAGIEAFDSGMSDGNRGFDVVVTDLGMPYVDGRKVAAAVKNASAHTPVIMLTGWGQRLIADNDVSPHVNRVLSKPPRLQEIRAALSQLVKAG